MSFSSKCGKCATVCIYVTLLMCTILGISAFVPLLIMGIACIQQKNPTGCLSYDQSVEVIILGLFSALLALFCFFIVKKYFRR